jgi:ParB family chromosome partitioning protein
MQFSDEVVHLPVTRIVEDPQQPRKTFDQADIDSLAASTKKRGRVMTPVHVRPGTEPDVYVLIGGARRLRATIQAGLQTIPAQIVTGDMTRAQILAMQLEDDAFRVNLNPVEQALAFQQLIEERELSGAGELAEYLGLSPTMVDNTLSLLKLSEVVRHFVAGGQIVRSVAYELAKLPSERLQMEVAGQVLQEKLTQQAVAAVVRRLRKREPQRRGPTREPLRLGAGLSVILMSRRKLLELQKLDVLERAMRIVYEGVIGARPRAPKGHRAAPRSISLSEFIAILQAYECSGIRATETINGHIPLIIQNLLDLQSHDDPVIRDEAIRAFNRIPPEATLAIAHLKPRKRR